MFDITTCTAQEISEFGRHVYATQPSDITSFEDGAQHLVQQLYELFRQPNGDPAFALIRIFRFGERGFLHPSLAAHAAEPDDYWLALMGTMGIEDAWRSRDFSQGHRVIPADAPTTPMLQAAFHQMGLTFGKPLQDNGVQPEGANEYLPHLKYFHLQRALGSPNITDQETFVIPYGIQSVVGFGGPLRKEAAYMFIGFTLVEVSDAQARIFAAMNPFVGTFLARLNDRIWSDN